MNKDFFFAKPEYIFYVFCWWLNLFSYVCIWIYIIFNLKINALYRGAKLFTLCFFGCMMMNPATNNNDKLEFLKKYWIAWRKRNKQTLMKTFWLALLIFEKIYNIPVYLLFLFLLDFFSIRRFIKVREIESNVESKSKKKTYEELFVLVMSSFFKCKNKKKTIQNIHKYI